MARLAAETVRRGGHAAKMREAFRWLAIYKAGSDSGIEQIEKRRHFYDTLAEIGGNQELDRIMPAMQIHLLRMQTLPYQTAEDKRLQLLSYSEVTEAVLAGNPKHPARTKPHNPPPPPPPPQPPSPPPLPPPHTLLYTRTTPPP